MPRRRKKRARKEAPRAYTNPLLTVRSLVDTTHKVYTLSGFLTVYAPSLTPDHSVATGTNHDMLAGIVISPLDTLVVAHHIESPDCREPLPGLVNDVVWSLVQRKECLQSRGLDGRNVLADGYATTSNSNQGSFTRPGIVNVSQNDNVSFCKSSRLIQQLHVHVGDEVLRMILWHTRLFVPMEQDADLPRGNFILVCGPPLQVLRQAVSKSSVIHGSNPDDTTKSQEAPNGRPKKKRRRESPQVTREMKPNSTMSRASLFYSNAYIPKIGLSKHHPLNDARMTSENLLAGIVNIHNQNGMKKRKPWRRLRVHGLEVCQRILQGHRGCDYPRLLSKYCPIPCLVSNALMGIIPQSKDDNLLARLGKLHTCPMQVVSFVASVLRRVFPDSFWGCEQNFEQVIGSVELFVNLRRQEKLPNKALMHGIRTNKMRWLHGNEVHRVVMSRSNHEASRRLTLRVLRWLYRGFIIPLLRSVFYVTETEFSAKRTLYYRKPVWTMFRSLAMRKLLQKQFKEIKRSAAMSTAFVQSMGFSPLKLLPKVTGVRPIAQLSRRTMRWNPSDQNSRSSSHKRRFHGTGGDRPGHRRKKNTNEVAIRRTSSFVQNENQIHASFMPTNAALEGLFDVLKFECSEKSKAFGTGLESLGAFYPRYHQYITSLKRHGFALSMKLVFASVDIEKCYDNICQPFLNELAKSYLMHDDYIIQQFSILRSDPLDDKQGRVKLKVVGPPQSYRHVYDADILQGRGLILEPGKCSLAKKKKLLELLSEHLHKNLLVTSGRFGNRFLVQSAGIPQGSIMSTLLCNVYYGEIERMIFNSENPQSPRVDDDASRNSKQDLMARIVDDFIYISTSKRSVSSFLQRMWEGKPDLGAVINRDKIIVSTPLDLETGNNGEENHQLRDSISLPEIPIDSRDLFPWCGILFNADTGEVSVDYSRFPNERVGDGLTVNMNGREGDALRFRMKSFVKPRCSPLFYDPAINSKATIVTNYFQMMAFAALKTSKYLESMLRGPPTNILYLLDSIECISLYAQVQIRNALRSQCPDRLRNTFVLNCAEARWLCWRAFHMVFTRVSHSETMVREIAERIPRRGYGSTLGDTIRRGFHQMQVQGVIL